MLPQTFRKRPVTVEAMQYASTDDVDAIITWVQQTHGGRILWDGREFLKIPTLEGLMNVRIGDWIVRGVVGEFYPCRPDIFEATYEEVCGRDHD